MHRGLIFLQLSLLWISSIYAAVPTVRKLQYKLEDNVVQRSQGFVTFALSRLPVSGKVTLPRSPSGKAVVRGTPTRVSKRDNNYNIVTAETPTATNAAGIDQDGTDYSYFVQAQFGSSNKAMYMLLDTGASTTWVMGSNCTSTSCTEHNTYGPSDSTTYVDTGMDYSVQYGTGSVEGTIVNDTVSLAGISVQLSFGVANSTSDQFTEFPFDGILGLSTNSNTWLAAVIQAKSLASNIFGVYLSRDKDGANDGEVIFGSTDTSKYTGDITYTAVTADGNWEIAMDDITVGGTSAGITGRSAYIDTGTSFIFGPPDDVKTLYGFISGANSSDGATYNVPCDFDSEVAFTFSGQSFNLSSSDFIANNADGTCTGNIYGIAYVPNGWLLGDTFLKNVYSVFDADKQQIGFASKVEPTMTSSSSASASSTMATPTSTGSMSLGLDGQETTTTSVSGTTQPQATGSPTPSGGKSGAGSKLAAGSPTAVLAFFLSTVIVLV
ncbi:aspartic peptidase domain-containing protein [Xylariaceae sp. FL0255]|nr:aspartic peptidase domain-containing protein [Xylariaceae sp. FL0255]